MEKTKPEVAILLTCHNRRGQTIECIRRVLEQKKSGAFTSTVILVDDGSTDGTSDSINSLFPVVEIIQGNGRLFWNRGMRLAFEKAQLHDSDFYLMLNDDTYLDAGAITSLLTTYAQVASTDRKESIIVGSTRNPQDDTPSYGGWRSVSRLNPANCRKLLPSGVPQRCDTMNGNCVLIPRTVVQRVGNLDPAFTHSMGDHDYGFRARKSGCALWVAPGYIGTCEPSRTKRIWTDESLSIKERWTRLLHPKGLPPKEWFVYTSRHCGPFWPLYWMVPYLKFWLNASHILLRSMGGGRRI